MSDSRISYNDVLAALNIFLIPLRMPESEEGIIHVNKEHISDLYTANETLATFNIISENDEIKNMFSFEDEDTKSLKNEAKQLLEHVIQFPKLMEKINKLMWFFGGVQIEVQGKLDEQTGGSKNLITLFLFSFIYLLHLTPMIAFVINARRTTGDFSNNKRNTINLPIPSLENEDKYTNELVKSSNQENTKITFPNWIQDKVKSFSKGFSKGFSKEVNFLEKRTDEYLLSGKILEVLVNPSIKSQLVSDVKKGILILNMISFKTSIKEKIKLLAEFFDTNKVGLATNLLENLLKKFAVNISNHITTGLKIINAINAPFISVEYEVCIAAVKHISKVMKNEVITQYGEINTENLYGYSLDFHGGKKRKKSKKTKKITKRRNKKREKSRNRRKHKKSLVFSYL
jgi:hypothetical protein